MEEEKMGHENLVPAVPLLLRAPTSKSMDEQEVEHAETSVQPYADITDLQLLACSEAMYAVLWQLSADVNDGSLVLLRIAGVKGGPVAVFGKKDALQLTSFKQIWEEVGGPIGWPHDACLLPCQCHLGYYLQQQGGRESGSSPLMAPMTV